MKIEHYISKKTDKLTEDKRLRFAKIFGELLPTDPNREELANLDQLPADSPIAKAIKESGYNWSNSSYKSDLLCEMARHILWTYNRGCESVGNKYSDGIRKDIIEKMLQYAEDGEKAPATVTVSGNNLVINE
jgi:hypothetical protein